MAIKHPTLPQGAIVLVTGVNGLIGSHVADQILSHGYNVRGTVRHVAKNSWLVGFFEDKFGNGRFELVEVPDLTEEGAFDEVVKGASGVVHVASPVNLDPDPDRVISTVVGSTLNAINAAAKESSVKRFVLTSSSSAVVFPKPNHRINVTPDTWNEESVQIVENLPTKLSDTERGYLIYMASKVKGEQALWKWVKENKSNLVVNSVLPGGNFGKVLCPQHQGYPSTTGLAAALYNNDTETINLFIRDYAPEYFVDVQDTARLHVAALIRPDVVSERIFAYTSPFNWNVVLAMLRRLFPDRKFREDEPGLWDDLSVIEPAKRAERLLQDLGRSGFTPLEESLKLNVEDIGSSG